ncbi:MAG: glycosyltransferase [Erysipelotrichia bacterium]|nr:glycosyltransferase [Erysipelotrichia bacterium]
MLYDSNGKKTNLNKNNLITVSRLDDGKKVNEIIDIFNKIKDENTRLYVIGDGLEYNNLKEQIASMHLTEQVSLLGYKTKSEIEKYMLESSLFMMASVSEGLPMVLLEAMSYGVPCIAYRTVSGVADIIKDGYNGFIIENRDQNKYIERVLEVLGNDQLRFKLSENAKSTAELFSKEEILKKWYRILK